MNVQDVLTTIERWAPEDTAWEHDSIGLQVGTREGRVRVILVCLDVTDGIVREALRRRDNLIVSHHPILFKPLKRFDVRDEHAGMIARLISARVNVVSAHTNLDFARGGTSHALAERLGLTSMEFLHKTHRRTKKIAVFVPDNHAESVAEAMAREGAGRIGNYTRCSFRVEGTGTFEGNELSNPTFGSKRRYEQVREVRLEMVVADQNLSAVTRAMKKAHPYEQVAYDIHALENISEDHGMGVIGILPRPVKPDAFASLLKKRLGTASIRSTRGHSATIRRVAVCGGSGADLLEEAIRRRADAFVTADVKYHAFHDASGRIHLFDAGHYETERPVVDTVVHWLRAAVAETNHSVPVHAARTQTNPIVYH
jgi:dinuclear metal center YbgI/SA1388 family protein